MVCTARGPCRPHPGSDSDYTADQNSHSKGPGSRPPRAGPAVRRLLARLHATSHASVPFAESDVYRWLWRGRGVTGSLFTENQRQSGSMYVCVPLRPLLVSSPPPLELGIVTPRPAADGWDAMERVAGAGDGRQRG